MSADDRMEVPKYHRRGITTALTLLDEVICEVEAWAGGREVSSVLYREWNTLSPEQCRKLQRQVVKMKQLLTAARDRLGLSPDPQETSREIWGRCAGLREHLMALESVHLRRYGAVPDDLAGYMDGLVPKLLRELDSISRVCRKPK
ncbi:MAG: hypothetical protein GXP25_18955 [Planctomycetes bacterium]|nr:hypothetical protein [Planctomycetota bacterium]